MSDRQPADTASNSYREELGSRTDDVHTAILQSEVEEEVYTEQADGYIV